MINLKGVDSTIHRNTKFAIPKNSNLLPDPGKEKPLSSTFDNQLIELESVDSTNNYAMARIHAGMATDGLVCLTREQWAGRGQRGKSWFSEPGQNLTMSLVIKPSPLKLTQQFLFSAAVSLGILDLLKEISAGIWTVKWPNDIYWNDRKAAGILIESVIQGINWSFAVIGIGMNLNQEQFPDDLPNAISLKQITGEDYKPVEIARRLVPCIQKRIHALRENPEQALPEYNRFLYKKDQLLAITKGNEKMITCITGVDAMGYLITDLGSFAPGEVQWVVDG